jgi:hypothetical protein
MVEDANLHKRARQQAAFDSICGSGHQVRNRARPVVHTMLKQCNLCQHHSVDSLNPTIAQHAECCHFMLQGSVAG